MKICVISFDFWNYDAHIVEELRRKGVDAHHINIGAYQHKDLSARVKNTISKIVLQRNLKNELRQEMILDTLKKLGPQDQILVINPELIDMEFHRQIKQCTKRYIAYLYDSLARCPAQHLFSEFDEIFTFDKKDALDHHFKLITNYNYLPDQKTSVQPKYDLVYLGSFDNRISLLSTISAQMDKLNLNYNFVVVGKKSWTKNISFQNQNTILYKRQRVKHEDIPDFYLQGNIVLDLVRDNQTGLSFRIFETMALKKKIITNNPTIKDYDFYNPANVFILNEEASNIEKSFFEGSYQEIPAEIYDKYTLSSWVETIFSLDL